MKIKNLILNFAAEAAIPHFRGVFIGSHVHFKKMIKTRRICTYRLSSRTKNGHETFITPISPGHLLGIQSCTQKTQFYMVLDRFCWFKNRFKTDFYQNPIFIKIAGRMQKPFHVPYIGKTKEHL